MMYTDRKKTMTNVMSVILKEEVERKKKLKESMSTDERRMYIANWKLENEVFLNTELGYDGLNNNRFLSGMLVAPSTSKATAPFCMMWCKPMELTCHLGRILYSLRMPRQPTAS